MLEHILTTVTSQICIKQLFSWRYHQPTFLTGISTCRTVPWGTPVDQCRTGQQNDEGQEEAEQWGGRGMGWTEGGAWIWKLRGGSRSHFHWCGSGSDWPDWVLLDRLRVGWGPKPAGGQTEIISTFTEAVYCIFLWHLMVIFVSPFSAFQYGTKPPVKNTENFLFPNKSYSKESVWNLI